MANVTGNIGSNHVELENAASEATLKLILQATLATTKEQRKAVSDLVEKAGLDPEKVKAANEGLSTFEKSALLAGGTLGGLNSAANSLNKTFNTIIDGASKLTDNQGKASDVFGTFAGMGGVIGLVAGGFQKLATFQEKQLATYQQLTQNGISFGGSLTNMRMAASSMYLSMDEFGKLMKENSQSFAKMGGTADQGAQAFTKVSQELMKGPMGRNLQALGYTAEQVNQGLASYIDMTGGRNAQEMKDTKALAASAAEYMTQLDALAEITGKSKEEQLQAGKEAAMNQAWQAKLMGMTEGEKLKAEAARAEAFARGGKGAQEALMSAALGFGPMTKASREYTAIAGNMNSVTMKQVAAITDSSKTLGDMKKIGTEYAAASVQDKKNIGVAGDALIMQGGDKAAIMGQIWGSANRAVQQGADTNEKSAKQAEDIAKKQKDREKSEAAAAVDRQRALQEIGQRMLSEFLPVLQKLTNIMDKIIRGFAGLVKYLSESPTALGALKVAAVAAAVGFTAFKVAQGYQAAKAAFGIGGGGAGGSVPGGGGGGGGAGKSIGSVAQGLGKVGPMLSSLGKGAGGMFKGIMTGIAGGIKAFANPQVMLGSIGFGIAIAAIGAGIAGAAWLLGKALPTLAEGIGSFEKMDGANLIQVGKGIGALGLGLAAFGAGSGMAGIGSVIGGLSEGFGKMFGAKSPIEKMKEFATLGPQLSDAGKNIMSFNESLAKLLTTDVDKIKNLAANLVNLTASLKELREASRPVAQSFLESATQTLKAALIPEATKPVSADVTPVKPASNDPSDILRAEMQTLNKISTELLRAMRDTAGYTKSTANTLASNGNMFRRA